MLRIHLTILALKRRYVYIITYSFSNRFQTDFKPFIEIHWNDKFTVGFWLTLNPILLLISFHPFLPTHPQPSQPIYFFVLLLAFKAKLMGWGKPWSFWWLYVKLVKWIGKFRSNQWRPTPQVICLTNFQCSPCFSCRSWYVLQMSVDSHPEQKLWMGLSLTEPYSTISKEPGTMLRAKVVCVGIRDQTICPPWTSCSLSLVLSVLGGQVG